MREKKKSKWHNLIKSTMNKGPVLEVQKTSFKVSRRIVKLRGRKIQYDTVKYKNTQSLCPSQCTYLVVPFNLRFMWNLVPILTKFLKQTKKVFEVTDLFGLL